LKVDRRTIHLGEPIKNVGTYMFVVEVFVNETATTETLVVDQK